MRKITKARQLNEAARQLAALFQSLILLAIIDNDRDSAESKAESKFVEQIGSQYAEFSTLLINDITSLDAIKELSRMNDKERKQEFRKIVLSFLAINNHKMMSKDKREYLAEVLQALDK